MKNLKNVDLNENVNLNKVKEKSKGFWKEFKDFAIKGNAIDLAIGMVVGAAFTSIVNSLVSDIITPVLGAVTGGLNYSEWFLSLDGLHYATLAEAQEAGAAVLTYGNFITAVINFLIVSMAIFFVFKKLLKFHKKEVEAPAVAEPTEKECPYCKSIVNIKATRCPHCTSEIE